jgi:hypothetical protein
MQLFDCATLFLKNIARKRTKDVKNEGEMLRYITETKGFLCQSQEVYRVGSTRFAFVLEAPRRRVE